MENSLREVLFIGSQNYSRWGPEKVSFDLLVDQPTVIFLTVEPSVDRLVDHLRQTCLLVDHQVDRA